MTRFIIQPGTVYFVGAGPGAPDLITIRGQAIIAQADLILYADSLVEQSVAQLSQKAGVTIKTSSGLHLEQMLALMVEAAQRGEIVARVHSGDPALYGAVHEQMAHLEDHDINYEIIPGVTAAFAAAAQLKTELTVPDVVQTIILTRTAGRTTMPEGEELRTLAAPGASLAIYLSINRIRRVIDDLIASGGYTPDTPVAVHHKVTWPDESHVIGTLADIADKVREAGYTKHALILVSPALDPRLKGEDRRTSSHLYDKTYTHRFRKAENFKRGKERVEAKGQVKHVVMGEKHLGAKPQRLGAVVISITTRGSQLADKLARTLDADVALPEKQAALATEPPTFIYSDSALAEVRRRWSTYAQLILVMPTGVAVRAIGALLGHKATDPAVVCVDEAGQSVIPLLGGHQAGANELAHKVAALTAGQAVITTASDMQGKPALDLPPTVSQDDDAPRWQIDAASALTLASASLVNDEPMGVYLDPALAELRQTAENWFAGADNLSWVNSLDELDSDSYSAGLIISHQRLSDHHQHILRKAVLYRPQVLTVGMGCQRGVPADELAEAVETTFREHGLALESIAALATAALKADEPGLHELAQSLNAPLKIVEIEQLAALEADLFSPSAAQAKFGIPGVAEPSATIVSKGDMLVPKQSFARCTVAVALRRI